MVTCNLHELTFAKHDPAHCLAPGLFRSVKKGERRRQKLDITYPFGPYEAVRFVGFEPLGADDLRFLQGLIALAGPRGLVLSPKPTGEVGYQLRLSLDPTIDAANNDALFVQASISKLLKEIGLSDGGPNVHALKNSLLRMSNVTVILSNENTKKYASFHLLSYMFDELSGQLLVALNPRITEAVLGRRNYCRIELAEVRKLTSDPARLIHQRLCGWIDPGKGGRVDINTLCSYVWSDEANPEALKKRRQTARKALVELVAVGWTVNEYANLKFEIRRPGLP